MHFLVVMFWIFFESTMKHEPSCVFSFILSSFFLLRCISMQTRILKKKTSERNHRNILRNSPLFSLWQQDLSSGFYRLRVVCYKIHFEKQARIWTTTKNKKEHLTIWTKKMGFRKRMKINEWKKWIEHLNLFVYLFVSTKFGTIYRQNFWYLPFDECSTMHVCMRIFVFFSSLRHPSTNIVFQLYYAQQMNNHKEKNNML